MLIATVLHTVVILGEIINSQVFGIPFRGDIRDYLCMKWIFAIFQMGILRESENLWLDLTLMSFGSYVGFFWLLNYSWIYRKKNCRERFCKRMGFLNFFRFISMLSMNRVKNCFDFQNKILFTLYVYFASKLIETRKSLQQIVFCGKCKNVKGLFRVPLLLQQLKR